MKSKRKNEVLEFDLIFFLLELKLIHLTLIQTLFPVLNINNAIKKLNTGMYLAGKKNQKQKKSHLTNQNYVEIWSMFNPGFTL